jgi:hypothetical protein
MRNSAIALAFTAVAAIPALANDSTAELTTGGLIFVHNEEIEMSSEDLAISAKEVSVRYRFFNKSTQDVTILVAFPMPDVTVESSDQNIAVPSDDPVNLLAFATTVNGKPVATNVEQRVIVAGLDRTQLLRSLGIPLAPHLPATGEAPTVCHRTSGTSCCASASRRSTNTTPVGHEEASCRARTLQTTYYWEQTFPSRVETVIEHRYKPSVGGSVQTSLGAPMPRRSHGTTVQRILLRLRVPGGGRACAQGGQCQVRRAVLRGASTISSRPAPTGRAQSGSSAWWSTRARPTISSASAARM